MDQTAVMRYDVAAVVITTICIASLILRRKMSGPINRIYLATTIVILFTAFASLGAEVYDRVLGPATIAPASGAISYPLVMRNAISMLYYTMRSLTAPLYFVLITAITYTSHRLKRGKVVMFLMWAPVVVTTLLVLTNPLHHLVFFYDATGSHRGPLILVLYASSLYYSLVGMAWLLRWRRILTYDTFATLALLYPIVCTSAIIQYFIPKMRLEMFVTSVVLMLLSDFVMRPERQFDALADAASLQAYREMCERAFITDKPMCLVYTEIVSIERLRELVGKDGMQTIVRTVSINLHHMLAPGDVLYYLRNGLFCIAPHNIDANRALSIARTAHEQKRALSPAHIEHPVEHPDDLELRTCVIRVPEDVHDLSTLRNFVRRFSHLVPTSSVTSFAELSKMEDFELQMSLSDVVTNAIRKRTFEVFYQPIYCMADGHFHSAEALVRLNDPQFGYVSPALFIPEAEYNGAIQQIGSILLDKIFAFMGGMDYDTTGFHYVEVNLSADQCVRAHTARELLDLAQRYNVAPPRINLEITETSSTYSHQAIARNVRTLAEAGFSFSLDDYGTGYSSLTRALDLPFSLVKFDKTLADGTDDPATRTVVEQSIAMMHSIGKHVLVEGVETREQVELLRAMGADYIQGFYFARPMPQDELVAFLHEHNGY